MTSLKDCSSLFMTNVAFSLGSAAVCLAQQRVRQQSYTHTNVQRSKPEGAVAFQLQLLKLNDSCFMLQLRSLPLKLLQRKMLDLASRAKQTPGKQPPANNHRQTTTCKSVLCATAAPKQVSGKRPPERFRSMTQQHKRVQDRTFCSFREQVARTH